MRKRLIERIRKRGKLGYTLTELLTVIGIIAVVCAIAIPSIFSIRNALRFAQANNYAKSIFLAAQQNLTEMRSDGGLEPVQSANGAQSIPSTVTSFPDEFRTEYVFTTTGTQAFDRVLPATSIDASLRDDQIIIEYNPLTGNVYAVFYYEKTDLNLVSDYLDPGKGLPRDEATRKGMKLGYYDGSGLNSSQIELEQTQAIVNFENGEEGIVQVIVPLPESFYGKHTEFGDALNITLSISGDQSMADGSTKEPMSISMVMAVDEGFTGKLSDDGQSLIFEYPIDSLANRSSFVNYASNTQASAPGAVSSGSSLTTVADESKFEFNVLPGENVTITANVEYVGTGSEMVQIAPGILSGVNPMFEYLQPDGGSGYVLAVSNGRNLQNLNAIAPSIAQKVTSVVFTSDIYWNDTVTYYNKAYGNGSTYHNTTMVGGTAVYDEAPARALPYFVPIHNADLFGTAQFIFPKSGDGISGLINNTINSMFGAYFNLNGSVPTLTDEIDVQLVKKTNADNTVTYKPEPVTHATIEGNGHKVYNINIDSTKYAIPNSSDSNNRGRFYATGTKQVVDYYFTGLFGYVNTPINNLHVVNPIVKGANQVQVSQLTPIYSNIPYFNIFTGKWEYIPTGYRYDEEFNNPATGALVGASGYNTLITKCSTYIDKDARGYRSLIAGPLSYNATAEQNWYGVSGTGAVGGLVGYAKSHRTTSGVPDGDKSVLAFSECFAAVNVSGKMSTSTTKDFGYSNGVGGLIGNSQMTNFYKCYASGNVLGESCKTDIKSYLEPNWHANTFGDSRLALKYNGRKSWGTGGFVGSSHGTKYTSCFATGNVSGTCASRDSIKKGAGGFVGQMILDGDHTYGNSTTGASNNEYNTYIAQTTIFTDCYAVGASKLNSTVGETFSGANGRTLFQNNIRIFSTKNVFNSENGASYIIGDFYRLYAPHVVLNNSEPDYNDIYVFRNSYYLSNYHIADDNAQANSNGCANPDAYDTFTNLTGYHTADSNWVTGQIGQIKAIELKLALLGWPTGTYGSRYFTDNNGMETKYRNLYAEAYSTENWEPANYSTTHGYDLNGVYPFTKIKGLDFYGDWPSKPSNVGIAYFESYVGDENYYYHFDKESTSALKNAEDAKENEDIIVDKDGYTILSASNTAMTVSIGGNDAVTMPAPTQTFVSNSKTYHIFRLSDAQLAEAARVLEENGEFYVQVTVKQDSKTYTMYFNPNVAKSQVTPVEGKQDAVKPDAAPTVLYIRSARQFARLSEMTNFLTADYQYIQQLDIDASTYLWADKIENPDQYVQVSSIGTTEKPFNASYRGLYVDTETLAEKQFKLSGFKPVEAGLFGVIGQTGVVADLIVECGNVTVGTVDAQNVPKFENVAVLAGVSNGIIDNVDLSLKGNVALTASKSAGLLAGCSDGSIIDCDVTVDQNMTVSVTAPNAGGLIGTAVGTAETKSTLTNSKVTLGGAFNVSNALNVGGIVGEATYLRADGMSVYLTSMTATAGKSTDKDPVFYAGGLAGYATESSFTGVVNGPTGNPFEIIFNGQMNAPDFCAAGAIGGAMNTTLTAVDATTNGISGNIAAGYLGNGTNTDVSNSFVIVSNDMVGSIGAAGVAGTIGSQSVFSYVPVTLNGVTIKSIEGAAAGYALEIKGEADVFNSPVTLGEYNTEVTDGKVTARTNKKASTINAKLDAAGYACVINGTVGDTRVVGPAAITGSNAAGFAVTVNGAVNLAHVSPALTADAAGYMLNANANLTVNGSDSAAGFALTIGEKGTIDNGYTLCSITSTGTVTIEVENDETTESTKLTETSESTETTASASPTEKPTEKIAATYGFAGTNNGTINRCMANVDIAGGFGFVGFNNGLVTTSYGWHNNVSTDKIVTKVKGKCYSSYFADMNSEAVDLYTADGKYELATLDDLNSKALNGFTTGYSSYPYNAKIKPEKYPYLMLRDHYGNWYTPPQYAYGVAYYEFYEDGTKVAHLLDLSDVEVTVEDELLSGYVHGSGLDNEKGISQYGYAVFRKADTEPDTGVLSELSGAEIVGLDYTSEKNVIYKFYELNESDTGIVSIPTTAFSSKTATVDTRFANAVNVKDNSYEVRTPEQLTNVVKLADANGKVTAAFYQTHSITLKQVTNSDGTVTGSNSFTQITDFSGAYNGGGFTISVADGNTWMSNVNGTVQNLNIAVTDSFSAPIFGAVNTASGNEKTPVYALSGIAVTAGEQVTEVPGALLAGTVNAGSTVSGCSVTAGTVTTKAGSFGGLVTTNAGTLSGNTVKITDLTVNGSTVVGGLTATNSGAIIGNSKVVNVNILYTNGSGAAIGGLVGENITVTVEDSTRSGTISGAAVSGSINRGDTADGIYKIGGVIGNMTGGSAEQSTSTVTVSKDWANEDTADVTFGSSGITNNGPVGMFVGYAGDVTLTNCSSTAANDTYQFLGQAMIESRSLGNNIWASLSDIDGASSYSDKVNTDGTYTINSTNVYAKTNYPCVIPKLSGCYFYYKDSETQKEQIIGFNEYYYSRTDIPLNELSYGEAVSGSFGTKSIAVKSDKSYSNEYIYYMYSDGQYGRVTRVTYKDGGFFIYHWSTATLYYLDANGQEQSETRTNEGLGQQGITFDVHTFSYTLDNNGKYLIHSNNLALGESTNVELVTPFKEYDAIHNNVFTYSNSALTATNSHPVTYSQLNYYNSATPVLKFRIGSFQMEDVTEFELLPVTATNNTYSKYTFVKMTDSIYQRQFVTYK